MRTPHAHAQSQTPSPHATRACIRFRVWKMLGALGGRAAAPLPLTPPRARAAAAEWAIRRARVFTLFNVPIYCTMCVHTTFLFDSLSHSLAYIGAGVHTSAVARAAHCIPVHSTWAHSTEHTFVWEPAQGQLRLPPDRFHRRRPCGR